MSSLYESLLLLTVVMLLPMFPAGLIYRWFPNDPIRMEGVLKNFKINATGAFAGYVTCCLLVFQSGIVGSARKGIENKQAKEMQDNSVWNVSALVQLMKMQPDSSWAPISTAEADTTWPKLKLELRPKIVTNENGVLEFYMPQTLMNRASLQLSLPDYESTLIANDVFAEVDREGTHINLGKFQLKQKPPSMGTYNPPAILPSRVNPTGFPKPSAVEHPNNVVADPKPKSPNT